MQIAIVNTMYPRPRHTWEEILHLLLVNLAHPVPIALCPQPTVEKVTCVVTESLSSRGIKPSVITLDCRKLDIAQCRDILTLANSCDKDSAMLFLLHNAHLMSRSCYCALLKTMEESKSCLFIILGETKLPPALASRCINIPGTANPVLNNTDCYNQVLGALGLKLECLKELERYEVSDILICLIYFQNLVYRSYHSLSTESVSQRESALVSDIMGLYSIEYLDHVLQQLTNFYSKASSLHLQQQLIVMKARYLLFEKSYPAK